MSDLAIDTLIEGLVKKMREDPDHREKVHELGIVFRQYLLCHESDIALGVNDFGELRETFVQAFGREPKTEG